MFGKPRQLETEEELYEVAVRALMRRAHSVHEMKQKLERRNDNKLLPSTYFDRNVYYTYITDSHGIKKRRDIGVDRIMWSSDYPHSGTDWPHSWDTINRDFAGAPEAEKQAILAGNAARVYHLTNGSA